MRPADQPGAVAHTGPGADPLPVVRADMDGTPVLVTAWELSAEEVVDVLHTGRIWLQVIGTRHPPVLLTTRPPFLEQP